MGKYSVDQHKIKLRKSKGDTSSYLKKNKNIHARLKQIGSIIILSSLVAFMLMVFICSVIQ